MTIQERYDIWLEENKVDILKEEKEINLLIKEFVKKFTKGMIANLTLDDYVVGKNSKTSFCYWVETKLDSAGNIHGAFSSKFGIYYGKRKEYEYLDKFGDNKEDAFRNIKRLIVDLIDASKRHDIEAITRSKLSNMFKNKIAYLYNPNDYMPFYSNDDIIAILMLLKLEHNINGESIESKKERIFKCYEELGLKECSPWRFMRFLYDPVLGYKLYIRNKDIKNAIVTNKKKISLEDISTVEDAFEENDYSDRKSVYTPNPKKENELKLVGDKGESIVRDYFRNNLKSLNINSYKDIKFYCYAKAEEANDLAGCDIEYVDKNGETWFVEVKSTAKNSENMSFYMSDIELNKMEDNLDHYYILYVNNAFHCDKIKKIKAKDIINFRHPVKYRFELK